MKIRLGFLAVITTAALLVAGAAATHAGTEQPSGTIAFLREPPGASYTTDQSLYVIHPDGGRLRRVTPLRTTVDAYAWSPNARLIAYIDAHDGTLWLVRPDGSGLRQLLPSSRLDSSALSWSPDGKEIAICGGLRIYVVPINGSKPRMHRRASAGGCGSVAWSPRGNEIAYTDRRGISAIHPDGRGRRRVTRNGYGWLTWSADGKQIAFATGAPASHGPEPSNYRGIGVVDADGRHFHLATGNAYNEYPAVWSPKGHQLLYGRANKGGTYVIGSNGRNDHRVTSDSPTGSLWPALAWSPDGNSIVYATPTGNGNLYILGADGHGKVDLTNTPDSDLAPSWVAR